MTHPAYARQQEDIYESPISPPSWIYLHFGSSGFIEIRGHEGQWTRVYSSATETQTHLILVECLIQIGRLEEELCRVGFGKFYVESQVLIMRLCLKICMESLLHQI